jgi:predicted metal-dependent hydrolase
MFQLNFRFFAGKAAKPLAPPTRGAENLRIEWKHGLFVHLVRSARARRYLLGLRPDGEARLVVPRRGSRAEALRFLERSESWLRRRREQWEQKRPSREPWRHGSAFLFRGEEVRLRVEETSRDVRLSFGDESFSLPAPLTDYRLAVLAQLRRLAEDELPPRTRELAALHAVAISRVTVRAQKTRWGSCSARGAISLNWRLIQAPALVRDYLIIHELMHRRQMNHSDRYWREVAQAFPAYREAERWLKQMRLESLG